MNDHSWTNGDSPTEWSSAPQADSLQGPPPRFRLFSRQEIVVGSSTPPWQHNKAAIVGFILGSVCLIFCVGRAFTIPLLVVLFIVFGFPASLIGIIVSAVSCRRPFRKVMARWGLVLSIIAFVLFFPLALTAHFSGAEVQGVNLLLGSGLIVIEVGGFGSFGALMIVGALTPWWVWLCVLWHGVTVEGHITERHTRTTFSRHRTKIISYFISYEYRCGGERYTHEQRVNREQYSMLDEGRRVAVRCRSSNPKVACIAKMRSSLKEIVGSLALLLFGVSFFGFSFFLVVMTIRTFPWGG